MIGYNKAIVASIVGLGITIGSIVYVMKTEANKNIDDNENNSRTFDRKSYYAGGVGILGMLIYGVGSIYAGKHIEDIILKELRNEGILPKVLSKSENQNE